MINNIILSHRDSRLLATVIEHTGVVQGAEKPA